MLGKDKLLKTLVAVATFLILFSLAVLAILNFAGGENKSSKKETTVTSSQRESRSSTTKKQSENTQVSTIATSTTNTTREELNTQSSVLQVSPPASNANEDRGERITLIQTTQAVAYTTTTVTSVVPSRKYSSQVFKTQAEAHAYGNEESVNIGRQGRYRANYEIQAVRDSQGNVTGYESNIYVKPRN